MNNQTPRSRIEFSTSVITISACMTEVDEALGDPIFTTADRPLSPSHLNIRLSATDLQGIATARAFLSATAGSMDVSMSAPDFDFLNEDGQDSFGRFYFGQHLLVSDRGVWLVWHDDHLRTRFEACIDALPCFSSSK